MFATNQARDHVDLSGDKNQRELLTNTQPTRANKLSLKIHFSVTYLKENDRSRT